MHRFLPNYANAIWTPFKKETGLDAKMNDMNPVLQNADKLHHNLLIVYNSSDSML